MPLAFRGTPTTGTAHNATSTTVAKPTGVAAGDLLLCFIGGADNADFTTNPVTTNGFTSLAVDTGGDWQLMYRIATGAEATSFAWSGATSGDAVGICAAISGQAAGSTAWQDPSTFPSGLASGTASASITIPSITLAASGDWCLAFYYAVWQTSQVITVPSGFTAAVASFGSGTTVGSDGAAAFSTNQTIAAGATGAITASCVSAIHGGIAFGVKAAPAAAIPAGAANRQQAVKLAATW